MLIFHISLLACAVNAHIIEKEKKKRERIIRYITINKNRVYYNQNVSQYNFLLFM